MKHIRFILGVLAYALLFKFAQLIRIDILFVIMGFYAFTVTVVLLWIVNYKKSYEKPKHLWGSFSDAGDYIIPKSTFDEQCSTTIPKPERTTPPRS